MVCLGRDFLLHRWSTKSGPNDGVRLQINMNQSTVNIDERPWRSRLKEMPGDISSKIDRARLNSDGDWICMPIQFTDGTCRDFVLRFDCNCMMTLSLNDYIHTGRRVHLLANRDADNPTLTRPDSFVNIPGLPFPFQLSKFPYYVKEATIGFGALKHFTFIIDFRDNKMILRPLAHNN